MSDAPGRPWWQELLVEAAKALLTGAADEAGRALGRRLRKDEKKASRG